MRAPVVLLVAFVAPALFGCAGSRPSAGPSAGDGAAAVQDPTAARIDDARRDYYDGVRAWVREDLPEAERLLMRCRETLAFADDEGTFTDAQGRDAESLLTKADYFLGRIDERLAVGLDRAGEAEDGPVPVDAPGWTVSAGEIVPLRNADVERWIRYFTGEGRAVFAKWLDRRSRYQPVFDEVFARHGLPPELGYHAMIESGLRTSAYSWAHAVGLWQFIRTTARNYGLRSDWWVDERRDPVRSTEAAALYMKALYEEFEDWELALAAYNVGEARVRKQIRRQKTRDFWKLRLPRETRNHVPKFYAAVIIGSDPEAYGFSPTAAPPPAVETVRVDYCFDFEALGESAGVAAETLADLNPSLVHRCTPPDEGGFAVVVPAGTGERMTAALAKLPEEKRLRWAHHRVRRGDTLSQLADDYRTSVRAIQEANRLKSAHFLSIGQDLLIPAGQPSGGPPPRYADSGGSSSPQKITYVVKQGDTLSEIAERYGTSARRLRRWNRIGKFIYPGQKLSIEVESRQLASAGGGSGRGGTVKVRRGDTLWDIARHHGVSLQSLRRANELRSDDVIRPGDTIRIP